MECTLFGITFLSHSYSFYLHKHMIGQIREHAYGVLIIWRHFFEVIHILIFISWRLLSIIYIFFLFSHIFYFLFSFSWLDLFNSSAIYLVDLFSSSYLSLYQNSRTGFSFLSLSGSLLRLFCSLLKESRLWEDRLLSFPTWD